MLQRVSTAAYSGNGFFRDGDPVAGIASNLVKSRSEEKHRKITKSDNINNQQI
jgi:hypothetical protein